MGLYTLIAIVVITGGVVAGFVAWLFYITGRELGQDVLKEGDKILGPIGTGLGNVLNSIAGNIIQARRTWPNCGFQSAI